MDDETDETITRIAAALRALPQVDPAQKASVLVAAAAERERQREGRVRAARRWRLAGTLGIAAAALLLTAWWPELAARRGVSSHARVPVAASAPAPARASARLTAAESAGTALQPVQLVLRAPAAHRVTVVGDFNGWDAQANTLARDPRGLWSGTVALRPGRHVYEFIVDDSLWMRDPRTPEAHDADFGRPGSVLFVGQP